MQLTPATARGIAIRTHGSAFHTNDLYDPEINIRYGAWYLKNLFQKYGSERARARGVQRGPGQRRQVAREGRADPVRGDARVRQARRASEDASTATRGGRISATGERRTAASSSRRTRTPTRRSARRTCGSSNDRYVLWMGRGDEPGWNVAQRFRLRADEVEEVRAEMHEILRERGRTALHLGGRHARNARRPRRAAARARPRRRRARPRSPSGWCSPSRPPRRRRTSRCAAPRRRDERLASEQIAAIAFGGPVPTEPPPPNDDPNNVVYLAYVDGRPVARASGVVRRARRLALRRLDAAGGARARCLPGARRGPLGRRGGARHAGARHAGEPDVAADPRAARVPRGLRDPHPARQVRLADRAEWPREGLGQGGLRDPGGGRAGRGRRRARSRASGSRRRRRSRSNFLENILADLRNAGHRAQPARGRRRLLARTAGRRGEPRAT